MTKLIDEQAEAKIVKAIKKAEKNTSGEIRVHIQPTVIGNIFDEAKKKFNELGMANTELKNGVLVFIAYNDKKFAILGDQGINDVVPDDFWDKTAQKMTKHFKAGKIGKGIASGVKKAGKALKEYFPYEKGDINELSDEVSFDE